ncbi:hypothetical protein GC177_01025 [bacterium]|nr:hypothetical protein [bacterium]
MARHIYVNLANGAVDEIIHQAHWEIARVNPLAFHGIIEEHPETDALNRLDDALLALLDKGEYRQEIDTRLEQGDVLTIGFGPDQLRLLLGAVIATDKTGENGLPVYAQTGLSQDVTLYGHLNRLIRITNLTEKPDASFEGGRAENDEMLALIEQARGAMESLFAKLAMRGLNADNFHEQLEDQLLRLFNIDLGHDRQRPVTITIPPLGEWDSAAPFAEVSMTCGEPERLWANIAGNMRGHVSHVSGIEEQCGAAEMLVFNRNPDVPDTTISVVVKNALTHLADQLARSE